MKHVRHFYLILFLLAITGFSCEQPGKPLILISKANGTIFQSWLSQVDNNLDFKNMYVVSQDSLEYYLSRACGIIISGGPDINPVLYGREDETEKCENIDDRRDTLELNLIRYAMAGNIPLLCICRGHQILNVANGGTLIPDIPADFDTIVIHRGEPYRHWVNIVEGSMLYYLSHTAGDSVNSFHHQAIRDVAPSFRAVAFAEDGLVEAIELSDVSDHSFILGVQWHPERMSLDHPLSGPVAEEFIREVRKTHHLN